MCVLWYMHLGIQIKLARIAKGITQQELAEKIFRSRPLVSHIEQTGLVNEKTFKEIRKVLQMPPIANPMDRVEESMATYGNIDKLKQEIDFLRKTIDQQKKENRLLQQLCDTQKDLIEKLKKHRGTDKSF